MASRTLSVQLKAAVQQYVAGMGTATRSTKGLENTLYGVQRAGVNVTRVGDSMKRVGTAMIGVGTAALVGLGVAAKSAANLEQAVGGTEAVFGDASQVIDDYAANAADKLGLSETAFRELTTTAGAMLKNLGLSVEDAAAESIRLTEIGADLAATYGGTTREAVEALGAALRGEADPAERFGLLLNQTAVNAKAVELGLAASTSKVDANAKAQATLALITEQSADAQGQFAREADTAAGKQQRLAARFEDLKAAIGEGALPVFEAFIEAASGGIGVMRGVDDATGGLAGKVAAIGSVGLVAAGGLSFLVGQALTMNQRFGDASRAVQGLVGHLGGLRSAAALAGGAAGLAGLALALDQIDEANHARETEKATEAFLALGDSSSEAFEAMLGSWGGAIFASDVLGNLLAVGNLEGAERLLDMAAAAGVSGSAIDKMRGQIEQKAAADTQAAEDQQTNTDAVEGGTGAYESQADAVAALEEAIKGYNDTLKAQFDPIFGVMDAQAGLNDALARQAEVYADAEATADQKAEADRRVLSAVVDLDGAAGELNRRIAAGNVTLADARTRFIDMATQMGLPRDQAIRLADSMLIATNRVKDLGDSDPHVSITATDRASAVARIAQQAIDAVHGRTVTIRAVASFGRSVGALFDQERQHGGPVAARSMALVGEAGPEVAVFGQAGRVLSHADSMAALSGQMTHADSMAALSGQMTHAGGGGGSVINVNVDARGSIVTDREAFGRTIGQAVARQIRVGDLSLRAGTARVSV